MRDERFAAIVLQIDYRNGRVTESIHVLGLDATLSLVQRNVDFDLDYVDGTVAELDRLYRQSERAERDGPRDISERLRVRLRGVEADGVAR